MRLIDADAAVNEIDDVFSVNDGMALIPIGITKALVRSLLTLETITPTVGGWISVEDRLPDDGMTGKLVYDTENGVHICSEAVTIQFPDGKTRISSDRKHRKNTG